MPAKNPRTNLTLPSDLDAVITELSELQDVPKARIIKDMLLEVQPILENMRDALKAVKNNQENALTVAKEYVQSSIIESNQKLGELSKEFKKYD